MRFLCRKAGAAPGVLLAIMLIAAQSLIAAHALEHETGNAQNPVCAACVAAAQLSSATVDSGCSPAVAAYTSVHHAAPPFRRAGTLTLTARQRGPPALA